MTKRSNHRSVDNSNLKVLLFFLNQELFAIPVADICEVNRIPAATVNTLKQGVMMGILNLHGSATCILNLKQILESKPYDLNPNPGWIAVKNHKTIVCFAVDTIFKFMTVSNRNLSTIPILKGQKDSEKIKFYARVNNSLIPVLNIKYIIKLFKNHDRTKEKQSSDSPVLSEPVV